jgi:hypothetical protein
VPNSYTTGQRASFSSLSSAFKALTQAQIDAWNAASGFSGLIGSDRAKSGAKKAQSESFNVGGT